MISSYNFLLVILALTSLEFHSSFSFVPTRFPTPRRIATNGPTFDSSSRASSSLFSSTSPSSSPIMTRDSVSINGNKDHKTENESEGSTNNNDAGSTKEVAVILNQNARSVNSKIIQVCVDIIGKDNVHVSSSLDEMPIIAEKLLNYKTVMICGGDGTLCCTLQYMLKKVSDKEEAEMPKIAYAPLGTGNAMGRFVGPRFKSFGIGKRNKINMLKQMLTCLTNKDDSKRMNSRIVPVPIMQATTVSYDTNKKNNGGEMTATTTTREEMCFFAGAGFDSLMLNDFRIINKWAKGKKILNRVLGSVAGYTVALFVRTLPQCVTQGKHHVNVRVTTKNNKSVYWMDPRRADTAILCTKEDVNHDDNTKDIDSKSMFANDVQDDEILLFEGQSGIIAASTAPYYGGGLKVFPFAGPALLSSTPNNSNIHLRLGRIHPLKGVLNMYGIFRGTYREYHKGQVLDFVGEEFKIELYESYPFQHSGEAFETPIKEFSVKTTSNDNNKTNIIEFIDFLKPRVVVDY
eukprot:CAMPEP_0178971830 /NCGR_PEP_ID=MMETSP0789-20121207/20571_1 /TAXON_ID=3005 /ORGANISM="Rhizosolenia setigera, Strain CCMP 1694" /LENGTH=516 /DNA_ID=CAMNT_0020659001 /DNA_START=297 /DNA_END=1844 /DNA_ORIENTATION=+